MEGNIPGVRPGKTPYTTYYDYPKRHRYQYDTQDIIYMFEEGKAYKIKQNGKCCYADNTDPDTGQPKTMIEIAPTSKAKDVGAKGAGEDWQQKMNLVVFKETTDFIITSTNTVAGWYQDIRVGKDGSQWMTVDIDYTNTVVGGLTDADFPVPSDCTSTCLMSEYEQAMLASGLGWEDEEVLEGFGPGCDVPTNVDWGVACRMQELCGTDCEPGFCLWSWPTGTSMDDPATACACQKCKATEFVQ